MKIKLISILLVLALAIASMATLASCDKGGDETKGSEKTSESVSEKDTTESSSQDSGESTSVSESEIESETDDGTPTCEHPYAAKPEGHWKPACDVCGKKEGKVQQHEFEEKIEDEGDLLLYSFVCTVCRYRAYKQEVPYAINLFFSAGDISRADFTGSKITQSFGFDAGVGFGQFSTEAGGSATVSVLSRGEASLPTGKYLVMKVRLPKSQTSFTASIKSNSANNSLSMAFTKLPSGWVTVIVDVTKVVRSEESVDNSTGEPITTVTTYGYQPDISGRDYYLSDLSISANMVSNESFCIAYALMCDTLEDAKSFTANEKTVITYEDIMNGGGSTESKECVDENGNKVEHNYVVSEDGKTHSLLNTCYYCGLAAVTDEPHSYTQIELENGDYTVACGVCGYEKFSAAINKYLDAYAINISAPNYYRNTKNGVLNDPEGDFEFASFSGQGNTAQIIFARNTKEASSTEMAVRLDVGRAKYFVVRMRTNKSSMNYTFTFSTMNAELVHGVHNGVDKGYFPTAQSFNVPINLGGDDTWTTYVMDLSQLIPKAWVADENGNYTVCTFYCNIGGIDYTPDVNIDFEYMAFVDDWSEVEALVSDQTVVNVSSSGSGNVVTTVGRTCVDAHSNEVSVENGVYKVTCAVCNTLVKIITVPEEINYYADLGNMNKYSNSLSKFLYDEENDVLFNRYEGSSACHLNLTGGTGAGTWTADKYLTGEYLVIKYRMKSSGIALCIATKDYGSDPAYPKDATRPYYSNLGTRVCVGGTSSWSVALIKIPDSARYTKGEELEIGIMASTGSSPYMLDIAYIAIVDSIAEAELLLEEGETLENLGESWSGTITEGVIPDAPEPEEPEEGREYSSLILGPDKLANPPENTTGTFNFLKLEEDGVSFVRINQLSVNKDGWSAINYLNAATTTKARYFAMKFRIGDNGLDQNYLKLYTGTTGQLVGEGQGVAFKVVEGGEWCVVVVDLLNCIGDKGSYMVKTGSSYVLKYFAIRPFSNNQKGASADAYMDIAYIAFFEHKSQIPDIVDTETYEWSIDKTTNSVLRTEDGSCVTCSLTEMKNGSEYGYSCPICNKTYTTKIVPDSVSAYYSAGHIATAGNGTLESGPQHFRIDGTTGDVNGMGSTLVRDGDSVVTRIYGNHNGVTGQLIWQKTNDDGNHNGTNAQKYTLDVGNSNYFVIRLKSNDAAMALALCISTTGMDGTGTVMLPAASAGADEWTTLVVDLSKVALTNKDENAWVKSGDSYVIDTFFMNLESFAADEYLDIDFIAFVDGELSDIAELTPDGSVYIVTDKAGTTEETVFS